MKKSTKVKTKKATPKKVMLVSFKLIDTHESPLSAKTIREKLAQVVVEGFEIGTPHLLEVKSVRVEIENKK